MLAAIAHSRGRIDKTITEKFSEQSVRGIVEEYRAKFNDDLGSGSWKKSFRGRDVMKRFVGKYGQRLKYELFRNLIIARMRDDEFRPEGMTTVLNEITAHRAQRNFEGTKEFSRR
jgi:hypothetical protein